MNKCPICKIKYVSLGGLISHISSEHDSQVPSNVTIKQFIFNVKNRYPANKSHGTSVISGKPTPWNEEKGRYDRFLNETENELYVKQFKERMKKVYGKEHLLDDPEVQKKMIAERKISGVYHFQDGSSKNYTGTYELDFCKTMDLVFNWDAKDIIMPACHIFEYFDPLKQKIRKYIPDVWIASLNLIVEIKASDNQHYRLRDLETEKAKDRVLETSNFNYVKVLDKNYTSLIETIKKLKEE